MLGRPNHQIAKSPNHQLFLKVFRLGLEENETLPEEDFEKTPHQDSVCRGGNNAKYAHGEGWFLESDVFNFNLGSHSKHVSVSGNMEG